MIPWLLLGTAPIPGGTATMRLLQRGTEFSIQIDRSELMNSRLTGSEKVLATLPCARLGGRTGARLLIGGLGMGFTLRAALDALAPDAEVVVAELVAEVVDWNRGPLAPLSNAALADPRVAVRVADVAGLIRSERRAYDAILLDVDNGPEGLTRTVNDRLYDPSGLGAAKAALRPGGILAVWSAAPDPAFHARLRQAGFAVEEVTVRAHVKSGARHRIWLATKPGRM